MKDQKDSLLALFEMSERVAKLLNDNGVTPTTDMCAVLVVVAADDDPAPLGGSLNYDKDEKLWKVSLEAEFAESVEIN